MCVATVDVLCCRMKPIADSHCNGVIDLNYVSITTMYQKAQYFTEHFSNIHRPLFALVCSVCASFDAAGQPLEKRVLKEYRARILKVVAVKEVYRKLREKDVIDDKVQKAITKSHTDDEARGYVFDHMMEYGNLKSLKDFCHVISSEDYRGIPAMQDLGTEMKKALEEG